MNVQMSIEIKEPPEKVWPFLVEPEKIMRWYDIIQEFKYTGKQRSGAGTLFYYVEKSGPRLMTYHCKVTEWVKNE